MSIVLTLVMLVVGFVLLIKGADFFVEGSASAAKKLHIPSLIIGLTVVAMGTSAPECAVSIAAALKGSNAMAISNVVGSNIFNLMVVCGLSALFMPLSIQAKSLKKEFPFSIFAAALMLVLGYVGMTMGHLDGVILLVFFALFLFVVVKSALKARAEYSADAAEEDEIKDLKAWQIIIYVVGGLVAIVFGGDMVVDASTEIARLFGLSENLIGLTIVAMGTSLPELVTSVVATRKGQLDMAFGNVIGSNIFNILFVIGLAATVSPMAFIMENVIDLVILIVMSTIVLLMAVPKKRIGRAGGIFMLLIYAAYMVYICTR